MQMDAGDGPRLLLPVTERSIGCAFRVANVLGHGFIEDVSEMPSLTGCGSPGSASCSSGGSLSFVGEYSADLLVEDLVIVELKKPAR
jgi:hypothetical protein